MHPIFHNSQVKWVHTTSILSLETWEMNKQLINTVQIKSSEDLRNTYTWADLF